VPSRIQKLSTDSNAAKSLDRKINVDKGNYSRLLTHSLKEREFIANYQRKAEALSNRPTFSAMTHTQTKSLKLLPQPSLPPLAHYQSSLSFKKPPKAALKPKSTKKASQGRSQELRYESPVKAQIQTQEKFQLKKIQAKSSSKF
jgi:hypothetical protein